MAKDMNNTPSVLLLCACLLSCSKAIPLSTSGRWIIDEESGERVKLACANWVSHLPVMFPEGLSRRPIGDITRLLVEQGFNCVRLTYAIYMVTRSSNLTVGASLDSLGLAEAKKGIARNNPHILGMKAVEAYEAVVEGLGARGIMTIMDNHVSRPMWCCKVDDGNGFFGDAFFDPQEWLLGLTTMAKRFRGKSQAVGMSLRNEPRGCRQNEADWRRHMGAAANAINEANPDLLVIVSGLTFDNDLSFLRKKAFEVSFANKLVHELHWYAFSGRSQDWVERPLNEFCANRTRAFYDNGGFVIDMEPAVPLFVSEFGIDQRGVNQADQLYINCILAYLSRYDVDWGLWTFGGSYYLNNGQLDAEEAYGVLDATWTVPKNPNFHRRVKLLQAVNQEPNSKRRPYYNIYHTESGLCLDSMGEVVIVRECPGSNGWTHDGDGSPIRSIGSSLCLKAVGDGLPVALSLDCSGSRSIWSSLSETRLHQSTQDDEGKVLCLEMNSSNISAIFTKECLCLEGKNCDPRPQWFQFVVGSI